MSNPCPEPPQVPPEPKLFVGMVEIHNTIKVPFGENDSTPNADNAQEIAVSIVKELMMVQIVGNVGGDIDIDIHETEAFRDGG